MIKKSLSTFKNLPPTAKAAICFTICNLFLKGVNMLTTPMFTRLLPEYEYGTLSLFMSYEQCFLIFATWEIALGAYQKGIFKYKNNLEFFSSSTQLITNLITIAVFTIVFAFKDLVYQFTGMDTDILILLFIFLMMQPAYSSFLIRKQANYDYVPVMIVTTLYTFLNLIVPVICILLFGRTAKIKFASTLIASIGLFLYFYWGDFKNYRKLKTDIRGLLEQWKFIIKFQLPLLPHTLSYLVLGQADRVMIGKMVGNVQAGIYSVAYTLASVIIIIQSSINQVLVPWCYRKMDEKSYDEVRKNTNYLLIGMGALALGTILVAPEIMKILFTKEYYDAVWVIPPVTVGVYFIFVYSVFVNIETYYSKTTYIMYVSVACGILNILLNYLLIDVFGYMVCGYTTMISYIVFAVGHYYFVNKICKKEIPRISLFDVKKIIFISITVICLAGGIILLYPYWPVRYGIILIILLIAFLFRNQLIKFIRSMLAQ